MTYKELVLLERRAILKTTTELTDTDVLLQMFSRLHCSTALLSLIKWKNLAECLDEPQQVQCVVMKQKKSQTKLFIRIVFAVMSPGNTAAV